MSNPMTQLVLDLIKNVTTVSKADGAEFSASIKDNFESCSNFESYLTGIAERQYVHCISQSLQSLAEQAIDPTLRPYLWNPIVASLIKCITALSERQPRGSYSLPPGNKSSSAHKTATVLKQTQGSSKSGNTKPKPKTKPPADISANLAKVSLEQGKGALVPSTKSAEASTSDRLKAYQEIRIARTSAISPFIKQLKGNRGEPVNCKVPQCKVCEKYFLLTPLTRCTDIRCHRPGTCTASGWYPHVMPHIWAQIKKAHSDPNIEVKFMNLPGATLPPLEADTTETSVSPLKRPWTNAALSSDSDSDEPVSPKIMSPAWNGESWSAQVEAASQDGFGEIM